MLLGTGLSSLVGAGTSLYGSGQQASAEKNAINAQMQMFNTASGYENPFIQTGQNALQQYMQSLPGLTQPFTAATLPSTPGYQFTLNQGQKGVQNGYAAQGLGSSGAAMKGASDYTTGLAQSTYNQQLQNYLAQNQQIASLLYQPVQTGANAANALTGAAIQTGQGIGSSMVGEGNALAAGGAGVSNSVTGGVNSALQYNLLQQLIQARNNPAATVNNAIPSGGWPGAGDTPIPYQSSPWG
jgi:hypothetical protein